MVTLLPFYNAIASSFGDNKAHLMGTLLMFGKFGHTFAGSFYFA